jgi:O-antigen ligase
MALAFLWIFVFTIPLENQVQIAGVYSAARITGLAALAAGLVSVSISGQMRPPRSTHLLILVFMAWSSLTWFWSIAPALTAARVLTWAQLLIMLWLIWEFGDDRKHQVSLIKAYVVGSAGAAGWTILNFLHGWPLVERSRYAATGSDPNELGLALVLSIPMVVQIASESRQLPIRSLCCIHGCLAVFAILLTGSRGAVLAGCVASAFVLWRLATFSLKGAAALAAVLALAIITATYVPASTWNRLSATEEELRTPRLTGRVILWKAGLQVFRSYPLAGIGSGAYAVAIAPLTGREKVAHNTFLSVLTETGTVGLLLFLTILATLGRSAWELPAGERAFWCALLLAWAVGVSGLTWESRKATWLVIALLTARTAAPRQASA